MGFVKKIFKPIGDIVGSVTGGLLGGQKAPKQVVTQQGIKGTAEETKSPSEVMAQEEEERRKRLLALNSNGGRGQLTSAGGDTSMAPVSRKTLFGQ